MEKYLRRVEDDEQVSSNHMKNLRQQTGHFKKTSNPTQEESEQDSTTQETDRSMDSEKRRRKERLEAKKLLKRKLRPREIIKQSEAKLRKIRKKHGTRFIPIDRYCEKRNQ